MTEICLEIDDVFKFGSLEACKGMNAKVGWLVQPFKKLPKIQILKFRKIKSSCFEEMTNAQAVLSEKKPPLASH